MEELQAARALHAAAERKLAEGTAALDGRFEEVDAAVQVRAELLRALIFADLSECTPSRSERVMRRTA